MVLGHVHEWMIFVIVFSFLVYTMFIVKNEKINFAGQWIVIFQKFNIFIPDQWQLMECDNINTLNFKNNMPNSDWEGYFNWNENSNKESGVFEIFQKNISDRKIVFDEDSHQLLNPKEFSCSFFMKNNSYEIVRQEGTATIDKIQRHYCDVVLFREKVVGTELYIESKGAVLNGFLEALSFENAIISIVRKN